MKLLGIISVGFDVTDQHFCIRQILEKKWDYNETVHELFIDFKKANDSVRREFLYNILIGFGVPMKVVRLIKMCLNETYSKVRIGKHLSDNLNSMVQHPVARVLQKFINLYRTQLQSYLFIYFTFTFNLNHTTCFGPSSGHPQV
jgi:hypothetical protein